MIDQVMVFFLLWYRQLLFNLWLLDCFFLDINSCSAYVFVVIVPSRQLSFTMMKYVVIWYLDLQLFNMQTVNSKSEFT